MTPLHALGTVAGGDSAAQVIAPARDQASTAAAVLAAMAAQVPAFWQQPPMNAELHALNDESVPHATEAGHNVSASCRH